MSLKYSYLNVYNHNAFALHDTEYIHRDICECSDEKPSIGAEAKKQDKCKKCEGDESEHCGGPEFLSVYEDKRFG